MADITVTENPEQEGPESSEDRAQTDALVTAAGAAAVAENAKDEVNESAEMAVAASEDSVHGAAIAAEAAGESRDAAIESAEARDDTMAAITALADTVNGLATAINQMQQPAQTDPMFATGESTESPGMDIPPGETQETVKRGHFLNRRWGGK